MKRIRLFLPVLIGLLSVFDTVLAAGDGDGNKNAARIVYGIDSAMMSSRMYFKNTEFINVGGYDSITYPEEIYRLRIELLNHTTVIPLIYNESVQKYIHAYSLQNKTKLNRIYGLSKYYFPLFESYLSKYNLPLELKYLAAVESALDPNAISVSGATGLWQFIKPTSDLMGLVVSSYIDERRDPYLATEAACRYLEYLYRSFDDWLLALAAYNGGPGAVKKAIIRANGNTDYWQIRQYMSVQMQNYVPAFIAMCYLMNFHREHSVVEAYQGVDFFGVDTLHITGPLNLGILSEELQFPKEEMLFLNPMFIRQYIPGDSNTYPLVLPHHKATEFLVMQNSSSFLEKTDLFVLKTYKNDEEEPTEIVKHFVEKGETLHRIAMKYNCTVDDILKWNGLQPDHKLLWGEMLIIRKRQV